MHGESNEFDATPAAANQFHLSTALGFLALASAVFAAARWLGVGDIAGWYAEGFRASPGFSTINSAIYVFFAWKWAQYFRRRILESRAWPMNGIFFGTVYGGTLLGTTLCWYVSARMNPLECAIVMLFFGVIGAGWATIGVLVAQNFSEWFDIDGLSPMRAAAVGALVGGATGYGSVILFVFWWPLEYFRVGLLAASFGAACAARGAFLQATMPERPPALRPETHERLRKQFDDLPDWDEVEVSRHENHSPGRASDAPTTP